MILNISGRTDIPAFYSKWFMNRIEKGFFDVRNPFYPKQVSRIYLEDVDAIVFCTKNPIPILKDLNKIDKPILFQITVTPYKQDIEPNVPPKGTIIEAIKKVSKIVGIDNVYVRYDPIFISDKYNLNYHIKAFDKMCTLLDGYVKHIIISFLDDYKNVRKNMNVLKSKKLTDKDYEAIGINFSKSTKEHNMTVQTCFEKRDLTEFGFIKDDCVSKNVASRLTGKTTFKKWQARKGGECNCVSMADIGVYNTCRHMCKYCYANYDESIINNQKHNPNSSLLIGNLEEDDIIKVRNS